MIKLELRELECVLSIDDELSDILSIENFSVIGDYDFEIFTVLTKQVILWRKRYLKFLRSKLKFYVPKTEVFQKFIFSKEIHPTGVRNLEVSENLVTHQWQGFKHSWRELKKIF
jgi:hypothetical protein